MKAYHDLEDWLSWVDALSEQNYVVIDNFLDDGLYQKLRTFLFDKLNEFEQAGIGAMGRHLIKRTIRGDSTYWLNRERDAGIEGFWELMEETRAILNRYCYLSLSAEEFHLAHYPPGGHYARHLDQFEGRNNRLISMVIYLNAHWEPGHGGELELLDAQQRLHYIAPVAKRCVLFKSAVVPHAVLRSNEDRYSLTGWLLYQPGGVASVLG